MSISRSQLQIATGDWLTSAASISPDSIDFLYADPPFNTGQRQSDRNGSYTDSWPDSRSYVHWLRARLLATRHALKGSSLVALHVDFRVSHHVRLLLDDVFGERNFVNHLIWSYGLGGSSPRRFARKHDDILLYCLDQQAYWFEPPRVPATSERMKGLFKKATDVLDIPSINNMAKERVGYPTQKPLALLDLLVRACCPPGGTVLDPCCGSGTTLVAAVNAGRHAVGFDINPDAVAIANKRLSDAADAVARGKFAAALGIMPSLKGATDHRNCS